MIKYSILLMLSLTCLASEPKFHYMQCVKIVKGFYSGCRGQAVSIDYNSGDVTYDVHSDDCKGNTFLQTFHEDELEKC